MNRNYTIICLFIFYNVSDLVSISNLNEQVYKNRICRVLEDPSDSLALIRNEDKLVAYRFPRDEESSKLIVYMHQQSET